MRDLAMYALAALAAILSVAAAGAVFDLDRTAVLLLCATALVVFIAFASRRAERED